MFIHFFEVYSYFYLLRSDSDLILLLGVLNSDAVSLNLGLLSCHTHGGVGLEALHLIGDVGHLDLLGGLGEGHDGAGELGGGLALLGGGVAVLGSREALAGEDDELGLVGLEALDVGVEGLGGAVGTAVVDGDADGAGVLGGHAGGLDLLKGEATAEAGLGRVLLGGAVDDGLQGLEGAGGDAGGTGGARETAGLLLGGLVEGKTGLEGSTGGADVLLVEVDVGDDVVVLNHLGKVLDKISIEVNSRLSEEGQGGGEKMCEQKKASGGC